jgi:hypothetical protein
MIPSLLTGKGKFPTFKIAERAGVEPANALASIADYKSVGLDHMTVPLRTRRQAGLAHLLLRGVRMLLLLSWGMRPVFACCWFLTEAPPAREGFSISEN